MELSGTSSNLESSKTSIASLSVDLWEHVFTFDIPNVCANLILTGDKRAIAKMCRMSTLSIRWVSLRFVNWSEASSLLSLFTKLKSLRLTSWSPLVKTSDSANAGIFPATLVQLTLRYPGSSALLNGDNSSVLLKRLVVLESLTVYEESDSGYKVSLVRFPSTLRTLRLLSSDRLTDPPAMRVDWTELICLPEKLTTLHLHVRSTHMIKRPQEQAEEILFLKWPSCLSSITDLSLQLKDTQSLILSGIEAQLRRLAVVGGSVVLSGLHKISSTTMPCIEVLHTNCFKLNSWQDLRELPSTLTHLAVAFAPRLEVATDNDEVLEELNSDLSSDHYAAPRNIRRLEKWNDTPFPQSLYPILLKHFRLLSLASLKHYESLRLDDIRDQWPSELTLEQLDSLQRLPPTLTALRVKSLNLEMDDNNNLMTALPHAPLRGLSLLEVGTIFPIELIRLLPRSLETVRIAVSGPDVLIALVQNPHIVNLKSLALSLASTETWSLDCNTIPTSITSLEVKYGNTNIVYVLDDHLNLTRLDLKESYFVPSFMPNLPCSLRSLSIHLHERFNLADHVQATHLCNMRLRHANLRELHITSIFPSNSQSNGWLEVLSPDNPPMTTFTGHINVPVPLMELYAQYYDFGGREAEKSLEVSSELFALSCLPHNLSVLSLHIKLLDRTERMANAELATQVLHETLKINLPIVWLPIAGFIPRSLNLRVLMSLPPHLSHSGIVNRSFEQDILGIARREANGLSRTDWPLEEGWFKPAHHAANALSLIGLAVFHPTAQQSSLLQLFMIANGLASALSLSPILRKMTSSGLPKSDAEAVNSKAFTASFFIMLLTAYANVMLFHEPVSGSGFSKLVCMVGFCIARGYMYRLLP